MGQDLRHHRRMHTLLDARSGALGNAKQLDAVAEFGRHLQIERRDGADALDMDRFRIDLRAESRGS